ncbi:hypothetical protein Sste5346_003346 [Sporothrix stenoceras]|uniref:Uncharacterized protein n=1 Tax=Sporothrix stenoceras TaxID=5173 RepID=A0ABR3ZCR9_9PEZI
MATQEQHGVSAIADGDAALHAALRAIRYSATNSTPDPEAFTILDSEGLTTIYYNTSHHGVKWLVMVQKPVKSRELASSLPSPRTFPGKDNLRLGPYLFSSVCLDAVAYITHSYKTIILCTPDKNQICGFLFRYDDPKKPPQVLGEYRGDRMNDAVQVIGDEEEALYFLFLVRKPGPT